MQQHAPSARFKKLNEALIEVVEDYGLVGFLPLNISDKESVYGVVKNVDKAIGYIFAGNEEGNESIFSAIASDMDWTYRGGDMHDHYFGER
mmetsp:Transcript_36472/g.94765  ORF Transcript_36472/g.94765 Transcript_36472/m.94765 type:complete len:91 (-) Transcript_36472:82-354(-)